MEVVSIWLKNAVEQFTWRLSLQLGEITLVIICGYSQLPDVPFLPFRFLKTTPYFDPKGWLFLFFLASKSIFCHFKVAFLEIIQSREIVHTAKI